MARAIKGRTTIARLRFIKPLVNKILLHATIDFLAGAYQQGIVRNILLIEVMLAIYVLGVGLVTSQIWKKEETHGLI